MPGKALRRPKVRRVKHSGMDRPIHSHRVGTMHPNPIIEFQRWFQAAQSAGSKLPEAMTLATATRQGKPSARMVLLKGVSERGFTFFTNYESRKSRELDNNPYVALVFHWNTLERQVRVEGRVQKISPAESYEYFKTRPRGSRLAAWISDQSTPIPSRKFLENRMHELEVKFSGEDIPLPPFWGGYLVVPSRIEFWLGQPNRLHDRFSYSRLKNGKWKMVRLAP
jgi:pyridoxamine 5'-phosphate oxidase